MISLIPHPLRLIMLRVSTRVLRNHLRQQLELHLSRESLSSSVHLRITLDKLKRYRCLLNCKGR